MRFVSLRHGTGIWGMKKSQFLYGRCKKILVVRSVNPISNRVPPVYPSPS